MFSTGQRCTVSHARPPAGPFPSSRSNLAIVLLVGGGTAAYGAMSNSVTLTVDGRSHTIRTFGSSVAEVLAARDVDVRPADKVSLDAAAASCPTAMTSSVCYAKPVTLSVDGTVTEHTVYETTVSDALDALGGRRPARTPSCRRTPDAALSRAPTTRWSSARPRRCRRGRRREARAVTTTAPTVGEALKEAGVAAGQRRRDRARHGLLRRARPDDQGRPDRDGRPRPRRSR